MIVRVECEPGHRAEPTPRRLWFGKRLVRFTEVLDVWPGADHTYFKLRAEQGALYILRHDAGRDLWELIMYQAPGGAPPQSA